MDNKIIKNQIYRLTIEGYTSDGSGIARADGFVVFVPFSARGDVLDVKIVKVLKTHAFGIIHKIIEPSPARQEVACPAFPKCGGCDFLHISYDEELALKTQRVRDCMVKLGGFDIEKVECAPSPEVYRSRNKALFPVEKDGDQVIFGFYRRRSHQVIATSDCLINHPNASALASAVAQWATEYNVPIYDEESHTGLLRKIFTRHGAGGDFLCIVTTSRKLPEYNKLIEICRAACPDLCGIAVNVNTLKTNLALGDRTYYLWGEPRLRDTLLGKEFDLSVESFYQVNHPQAEQLYKEILRLSDLDKIKDALDLYCGVGTITLSLAPLCRKVLGAEIVERAIVDARENAKRNNIDNAEFFCGDAGKAAEEIAAQGFKPYTIVCDPPRKGMDETALNAVLSMSPERIIYVACDPASLARDSKYLCERGYELKSVSAWDMFPRTANVESIALLCKAMQ
ncbi:MAG: 23S rRNA (uracil(1939)-C(5))-methyltransferase RlmD [Clostridia bacterium]|nr:23S rRNA (uracil(1939)-C(5))-methyltransferase RlmD [Clostridia bacterium]